MLSILEILSSHTSRQKMLTLFLPLFTGHTLSSSFSLDGDVEAQSKEGGSTKTQGQCWHKSPMPKPVLWCLKKVLANGAQMPVLAGKLVFQIPLNPFFLCFFLFLASATSSSHDLMTFLGLFCHLHLEVGSNVLLSHLPCIPQQAP